MAATLRLSEWEQETLRKKAIKLNHGLVKFGKVPLRDSEILHRILVNTLPYLESGEEGEPVITEGFYPVSTDGYKTVQSFRS